tara:strand:- start:556 stop:1476 length:921 start_codon:yes stop_codon:yes gene_type:complete
MSCNSCSNITLPGVAGPAGAAGSNGSNGADGDSIVVLKVYRRSAGMPSNPNGGSYVFDTNTLTPPSGWSSGVPSGTDPCWVSHGTASVNGITGTDSSITWSTPPVIAFENGADGITLLHTLTSASSDITSGAYTSALPYTWGISSNTLNTNGDTLRLQAQSMITPGSGLFTALSGMQVMVGNSNPPTQAVEIGYGGFSYDFPNFQRQGNYSYILEVDMVRVSSTTIRMESKLMVVPLGVYSDYAQERVVDTSASTFPVTNSSQVITVSDLGLNSLYVDIKLNTSSASQPVKLLYGKLYWLNKLVNT